LLAITLIVSSFPLSASTLSVPTRPANVSTRPANATIEPAPTLADDNNEKFVFDKVDQELLSQIKLLDERFEKEGAVYHESALDAYLTRVGNMVVADRKFENVEWKFRALRDPVPNAFALPNGSIYINTGLLALLEV
jgi:predicted Zn-dependent protease